MIAAGVNAKALSTYMGHSSITITLDRSHLMPGSETEAAGLLEAYLERGAGGGGRQLTHDGRGEPALREIAGPNSRRTEKSRRAVGNQGMRQIDAVVLLSGSAYDRVLRFAATVRAFHVHAQVAHRATSLPPHRRGVGAAAWASHRATQSSTRGSSAQSDRGPSSPAMSAFASASDASHASPPRSTTRIALVPGFESEFVRVVARGTLPSAMPQWATSATWPWARRRGGGARRRGAGRPPRSDVLVAAPLRRTFDEVGH